MMKNIQEYSVVPSLPDKLSGLSTLAANLCWSWDQDAIELFRRMDPQLWETTRHNPAMMLQTVDQQALEELADDDGFVSQLERVGETLKAYIADKKTWFARTFPDAVDKFRVAYFSAEFGITECIPIYSGGLGILSGDHVKSASDLGVPLVGVGLMYQHGYFRQYLNIDGYQQESYFDNDPFKMPLHLQRTPENETRVIQVEFPGRNVAARIWHAKVGRVNLYLLDTNLPENSPNDRTITSQLYGGDKEMRIQQEIMMGVGGVEALAAMDIEPCTIHMNEGHAAFSGIGRILRLIEEQRLSFEEALTVVRASGIFTTHTPVPAGIDIFEPTLVDRYFSHLYSRLGIDRKQFLALGRRNPENDLEPFNMSLLAMRLSAHYNGVSRLHGAVSRSMWCAGWPEVPVDDIPITHVTNGIHIGSWISRETGELYDRYLGHRWREDPTDQEAWDRIESLPEEALWRTHELRRERLVSFARRRLKRQLIERGASSQDVEMAERVLDPNALTIGFARRFASYKRATLILRNVERLTKMLTDEQRPVQFVFAGKAHPRDEEGKALIRQIIHFSRDPEIRRRVVFLENYDMIVSRYMVQGVDVWLNNPRRPMEASGTSGMKVVPNGGLNLSVLDGWWVEGYEIEPNSGWAIGKGEEYDDLNLQDEVEANALYNQLETDVIPLFYDRSSDGLPRRWIEKMKASIGKLSPVYNTHRMVREYVERFYMSAAENCSGLREDDYKQAREFAAWKKKVLGQWSSLAIEEVTADTGRDFIVGQEIDVTAKLKVGGLSPGDLAVEVYYGPLDAKRNITGGITAEMQPGQSDAGTVTFSGKLPCRHSGQHGYTLRVLPRHEHLANPYELGLILWR
ncbi:MAG: glycosyltransferase family 1 protein [Candidatus Glassbacteria bacterium]|nr:glycosyltransferase family 1 protein [Candidatus Glassbacteria bacterium]